MLNSLTKKRDFDKIYKNGKSSYNTFLGVKVIKNEKEKSRFGIVISTKVSKKATERNKIKRQIRQILKNEQEKIKKNIDCIIITRPDILNKEYNIIEQSIQNNLKKLKLYK